MGVVDKARHYNLNSYTIEDLKKYAQAKGGDCLSKKYTNVHKKYKWVCAEGHTWFASFHSVYNHNSWCPICTNNKAIYHSQIKKLVKTLKLEVVRYTHKKVILRCQYGHEFSKLPSNISKDIKCPVCEKNNKQALLLNKVLTKINLQQGNLLSNPNDIIKIRETYVTCSCKEGHVFQVSLNNLLNRDSWCRECRCERKRKKLILHYKLKKRV